jgi:hypothetical protein
MKPKGKATLNSGVVWWGGAAGLLLTSWGWLGHPSSVLAAPSPTPEVRFQHPRLHQVQANRLSIHQP